MSRVTGIGLTPFGRLPGRSTLDLMSRAATDALTDAGLERREIDGLITGYSTTHPHLMLSTVFAEHFGLRPTYAHAVQLGGATGFALVMLAHLMVEAGAARRILVVAGENRLSGQSRDAAVQTLAQVGSNLLLAKGIRPERQGWALALKQAGVPAGTMLGGLAVPLLGVTVGWRWAYVAGALGALAAAASVPGGVVPPGGRVTARRAGDVPVRPLVLLAMAVRRWVEHPCQVWFQGWWKARRHAA